MPTLTLAAVTGLVAALLALLSSLVSERIDANKRAAELQQRLALLPLDVTSEGLRLHTFSLADPDLTEAHLLGVASTAQLFFATSTDGLAAVIVPVAAAGYGGPIRLLVAIDAARVLGVGILEHHESSGWGGLIEPGETDWLAGFARQPLPAEDASAWALSKDGGHIDQLTGATFTANAVIRGVHNGLLFYTANWAALQAAAQELR